MSAAFAQHAIVAPNTSAAVVTPLRFKMAPPNPDGSRRRLALRDGWRIQGNLVTLVYSNHMADTLSAYFILSSCGFRLTVCFSHLAPRIAAHAWIFCW